MPPSRARPRAPGTRPEEELFLCCARTRIDPQRAERVRGLLRQEIDWTYLIRTAHRHGVMSLLYASLNSVCPELVPRGARYYLRDHFCSNAARNLFLTDELLRLLKLLAAQEIAAVPFKGPVLAACVYGNLALRQFGDLDILVHKRDVTRARDLLVSEGYQPPPWLVRMTAAQRAASLDFQHYHYQFVRGDGRVMVELHWGLIEHYLAFRLPLECLWERLEQVSLLGTRVRNFPPEGLLLFLCAHGAKHGWERLEWICGVAELLRTREGLDWARVLWTAERLGSGRMLRLGLLLANDLLGTTLAKDVQRRIRADAVARSLAARVSDRLFREPVAPPRWRDRPLPLVGLAPDLIRFHLGAKERWRDRARYVAGLARLVVNQAVTPGVRDVELLPLPASLAFVHYLLRPLRLLGEQARRSWSQPMPVGHAEPGQEETRRRLIVPSAHREVRPPAVRA